MVDSRRDPGEASYLHHQDDHPDGSQQELVVIQPLFHFFKAALKWKRWVHYLDMGCFFSCSMTRAI